MRNVQCTMYDHVPSRLDCAAHDVTHTQCGETGPLIWDAGPKANSNHDRIALNFKER